MNRNLKRLLSLFAILNIIGMHSSFGMNAGKEGVYQNGAGNIRSKLKVIKTPVYAENWFTEKWRTDMDVALRGHYLANQNIQELKRCKSSKNLNKYHLTTPIKYRYTFKRNGEALLSFIRYNDGAWSIVDETEIWYMPKEVKPEWVSLMEISAFKRFIGLSKDDFYDKSLGTLSETLKTGGIYGLLAHFLQHFITCYNAFCKGKLPKEKETDIYNSLLGFYDFCQTLRIYRDELGLKAGKDEDDLFSQFKEMKEELVELMEANGSIKV